MRRSPLFIGTVFALASSSVACESGLDPVPNDGSPPGLDVEEPYPIDRGDEGVGTPGKYKGLWLRLADTGQPAVTQVDSIVTVVCFGMMESAAGCGDFVARITSHWLNERARNVVVVNCGQDGFGIESWADPEKDARLWEPCMLLVREWFGLLPHHVRVVYADVALERLTGDDGDRLPAYPDPESGYWRMKSHLTAFTARLPNFFPDLQAVYLSSRTYGGFAAGSASAPVEPNSYEEGHAVNSWIGENPERNGIWFGWGAYQWAPDCGAGVTNGQEICYFRDDYAVNGYSLSPKGRGKMSWQIHYRLRREPWYRGGT